MKPLLGNGASFSVLGRGSMKSRTFVDERQFAVEENRGDKAKDCAEVEKFGMGDS